MEIVVSSSLNAGVSIMKIASFAKSKYNITYISKSHFRKPGVKNDLGQTDFCPNPEHQNLHANNSMSDITYGDLIKRAKKAKPCEHFTLFSYYYSFCIIDSRSSTPESLSESGYTISESESNAESTSSQSCIFVFFLYIFNLASISKGGRPMKIKKGAGRKAICRQCDGPIKSKNDERFLHGTCRFHATCYNEWYIYYSQL
jgi:hypothetical protein